MFITDEERLAVVKACRDCPMCHHIDRVPWITGKESNTPRGRAMTLWGLEKQLLSWEDDGVCDVLYKALLDGLPMEWCDGNYDNDELVIHGRRRLVEKGQSPAVVKTIARNIETAGNPFSVKDEGVKALVDEAGGMIDGTPELVVFFGSSARLQRKEVGLSFIRVLRHLGIPFEVLEGESDSGFLSYQLGDFKTSKGQAQKLTEILEGCKAKILVSLSASAYRMFTTRYMRFGAALPEGMTAMHATEFLSDLLDRGVMVLKKKIGKKVTYHDPSCLARYTYVIEPPRKLLSTLAGSNFVEMEWSGPKAHSAGETGGLSFTYPDIAEQVSRMRVEEALAVESKVLVSSDCFCEEMLDRSIHEGEEIEVKGLIELIENAL